jgi:hypothetical protein
MVDRKRQATEVMLVVAQSMSPYDTGNLARNGTRMVYDNGWCIKIGGEIAPYAEWLHEKNGTHKGYIDRIMQACVEHVRPYYEGTLDEEELLNFRNEHDKIFASTVARKILERENMLYGK